jgi:hypothetical protein
MSIYLKVLVVVLFVAIFGITILLIFTKYNSNITAKDCIPNNKIASDNPKDDNPTITSGVPIITICFDTKPSPNKEVGVTLSILPRLDTPSNGATTNIYLSKGFTLVSGNINSVDTFNKGKIVKKHIVVRIGESGPLAIRGCAEQKYPDGLVSKCDLIGGTIMDKTIEFKRLTVKEYIDLGVN